MYGQQDQQESFELGRISDLPGEFAIFTTEQVIISNEGVTPYKTAEGVEGVEATLIFGQEQS